MNGRSARCRLAAISVLVALGIAIAGCGTPDGQQAVGAVGSKSFQGFGTRVRHDRAKSGRTFAPDKAPPGTVLPLLASRLNPILTDPVDITRDGTYTLQAGPVDATQFDPELFSLQPPTDKPYDLEVIGRPAITDTPNGPAIRVQVQITGVASPYPGYRVWFY